MSSEFNQTPQKDGKKIRKLIDIIFITMLQSIVKLLKKYTLFLKTPRIYLHMYGVQTKLFFFSLTSLSRLFHSYRDEPIGRWGETGVPRENQLTHPQAELGLSHMWPVRGSNIHLTQR